MVYASAMIGDSVRERVELLLAALHPPPFQWQALGHGVGGSVWRVTTGDAAWFVKLAPDDPAKLAAEAEGLNALARCGAVRVPQMSATGPGILILEWLQFSRKSDISAAVLGEQLARQHHCIGEHFGWPHNNFIGATPQFNISGNDWPEFFRVHRLGFQLRFAAENGCDGSLRERGARLMEILPAFFRSYWPQPSLLHGDLWGGNWGVLQTGEPVIFDPAVYYGDREADIAMTELFGGFGSAFYSAYDAGWPRDAGYRVRRDLYNLYHVLNHFNLFGGSYAADARHLIERLLAEAGHSIS